MFQIDDGTEWEAIWLAMRYDFAAESESTFRGKLHTSYYAAT